MRALLAEIRRRDALLWAVAWLLGDVRDSRGALLACTAASAAVSFALLQRARAGRPVILRAFIVREGPKDLPRSPDPSLAATAARPAGFTPDGPAGVQAC